MICKHQDICSGCSFITTPIEIQRQEKLSKIKQHLPTDIEIVAVDGPSLHFRDRTDLTLHNGKFGFYDRSRKIFSLTKCEIFSEDLQRFFAEFSLRLPQIKKGSLRLRNGFHGKVGLWLDFANIDIKNILDEKIWIQGLLEAGIEVEFGQKKKRMELTSEGLRIQPPQMKPWFSSLEGTKEVPLNCYVSSFTQPSRQWNKIAQTVLLETLAPYGALQWLEVGSGIGNFTRPLLQRGDEVIAIENDVFSVECLKANTANETKIKIRQQDFNRLKISDENFNFVFCDPPRSGLGAFAESLLDRKPQGIIYVSCDFESWQQDALKLGKAYHINKIYLLDQFPHTPRMELLSFFQLR